MRSLSFKYGLISLSFFFILAATNAQKLETGPQVLSFHSSVDDTEQPYGLYLPKNYNPEKKYPFVVMLHGAGSNHRLGLRRVFGKSNVNGETDVEASLYFPEWKDLNYIVATPFARGTFGYQGIAELDVLAVMEDVKKRFSIDEDRTYLTGLSMGGGGTLWLGLKYPDKWAAIAPVCPAPPNGTADLTPNAFNLPVHIFHGDADPVVPPAGVRDWVENLKKEGVAVEYTEYPGVQHDSWVNAYKDEAVFEWFDQFERNLFPKRVKLSTASYDGAKAYWVQIHEFSVGTVAKIDAQFKETNSLEVKTENIQNFTLNLEGHPKFKAGETIKMLINGTSLRLKGEPNIVLSFREGQWSNNPLRFTPLFKRAGSEGPMAAAVMDRHIYVYGTADNPPKEELDRRRKQAEQAADWSYYRGEFLGRIMVFPRVLSDQEVRPSDLESANLILFGQENTNSIIAQFSDELPMKLEGDPNEFGLAFIYPMNNRYLLINSGISIMDAPDTDRELSMIQRLTTPRIIGTLLKFDDYVLYSNERVISSGHFTNEWQLKGK